MPVAVRRAEGQIRAFNACSTKAPTARDVITRLTAAQAARHCTGLRLRTAGMG